MEINKSIFKSKTFYFGILTAVLMPIFPELERIVTENPKAVAIGWGVITVILRKITKGKVNLLP